MRESIKVLCITVLLFGVPTAAVLWLIDNPSDTELTVRWVSTACSLGALLLFLKLHFQRDLAPDFLKQQAGDYFNRDGFCFAILAQVPDDGVLRLQAWFQNQYERPCRGRIALRPSKGFFMNRPDIQTILFDIECEGAAYGVASLPLPLDREFHGKRQAFEVGASVEYPDGKGKQLRFRDGLVLRSNSSFKNSFGTALTVAGAMAGNIILSRPASVKIEMPMGVAEVIPEDVECMTDTLWRLGDPQSDFV